MIPRSAASAPALRAGGFFAPVISALALVVVLAAGCVDRSEEDTRIEMALRSLNLEGRAAQLVASPLILLSGDDFAQTAARRSATLPSGAPGMFWIIDARPELLDSLKASFGGTSPRPLFAGDLSDPDLGPPPEWLRHIDIAVAPAGHFPAREEGGLFDRSNAVPLGLRVFSETNQREMEPVIWDAARASAISLRPVRRAIESGDVGLLIPPPDAVTLDPADTTAAWASPDLVSGLIRRDLGWDGLVLADLRGRPPRTGVAAAVSAIRAGADLVLTDLPVELVSGGIADAVRRQELDAQRVDDALRRLLRVRFQLDADGAPRDLPAIALSRTSVEPAPPLAVVAADSVGMSAARLDEITEILEEGIGDSVFTAAAAVVGRHGAIAFQEGVGTMPDSSAVSPTTTRFDLASLSKVVGTTTAVGILVDRGEMELDEPVERYVEEFSGGDKDDVTIRHLLSHTSGLPAGIWLYGAADSEEGAYERLFRVSLQREPGEAMEYSDLGMILLALAVERVTEMPLDEFLALNVFHPLGMRRTTYLPPASEHAQVVPTAMRSERSYPTRGVVHDGNAFRLNGVAGHAGLFSTASDLAVFAQMMLEGGTYAGRQILSPEIVDTLIAIQQGAGTRALGWDTPADRSSAGRYLSSRSFGHTGFTGTSIWIDPLRDIFVILLTNRTYPDADSGEMFDVRRAVHEAAVLAIDDIDISRRPGSR